ncbi:hypothetical protein MRB53_042143 [Persea americana]|nr:hypothetical protein MRB53_042143 [Persea americana]
MQYGFLTTLLAVCHTYYAEKRIGPPSEVNINAYNRQDVYTFRSRRHYHIINDLRYLLCTTAVQRSIPSMRPAILQFLDWLTLFQGQNPQRRKHGTHVEFESDNWIAAFNVTMQIAKHVQLFAKTFIHASRSAVSDELMFAIEETCKRAHAWAAGAYSEARPRFEPVFDEQDMYASEPISFHHPLHWLLVGLAAHLRLPDKFDFLSEADESADASAEYLSYLYYPLRVIHMTWEIRCGLWVRNGQSARAQLFHYCKVDTREYCIDKDVQFVQLLLAAKGRSINSESNQAMEVGSSDGQIVADYRHTQRQEYVIGKMLFLFESVPEATYIGSDPNLINMQDHFLFFLIVLFSERNWLSAESHEDNIARSLRQGLIFGPQSHSELAKLVSDDYGSEACFDRIVADIADFTPPTGLEDTGKFVLKELQYAKVDPYYQHYTLQQIDDANDLLKKQGIAVPEVQLTPIDVSPYNGLVDFVYCEVLETWIEKFFDTLLESEHDKKIAAARESLIDKILHLYLLTLQEEEGRRVRGLIAPNYGILNGVAFHYLRKKDIGQHPAFRAHKHKIALIQDRLKRLWGEGAQTTMNDTESKAQEDTQEDESYKKRKLMAKERQAKLMRDMQSSQAAFMDNNMGEIDSSEDLPAHGDLAITEETAWTFPADNCLICQAPAHSSPSVHGVLGCFQVSILDRAVPESGANYTAFIEDVLKHPCNLSRPSEWSGSGPYPLTEETWRSRDSITTCGHIMHWTCYDDWFTTLVKRNRSLAASGRRVPDKSSFQCPLCRTVGNVFLPIIRNSMPPKVLGGESELSLTNMFTVDVRHDFQVFADNLLRDLDASNEVTSRVELVRNALDDSQTAARLSLRNTLRMHANMTFEQTQMWQSSFRQTLLEHTGHPVGDDNYSTEIHSPWLMTQIGLLTASIVDIEIAMRGATGARDRENSPIYQHLSEQHLVSLRTQLSLSQVCLALGIYQGLLEGPTSSWLVDMQTKFIIDGLLDLLRHRHVQLGLKQPNLESGVVPDPSLSGILHEDIFAVLVELSIIDGESRANLSVGATILLEAEMIKVVRSCSAMMNYDALETMQILPEELRSHQELEDFAAWCLTNFDRTYSEHVLRVLYAYTRRFALVFLRKFAILLVGCYNYRLSTDDRGDADELENLCSALHIPPLSQILRIDTTAVGVLRQKMTRQWVLHADNVSTKGTLPIALSYPLPFTLIKLPDSLDLLFEECLTYKCPKCRTVPNLPALCLFCGKILCFQSQCCWNEQYGIGECSLHMQDCGRVFGLFFIVKRAALLIKQGENGSFAPAPYLDIHGETDPDLRRGKPQFLNERRYEMGVRQLLLQHQIPTWLASRTDAYDMGGWQTT